MSRLGRLVGKAPVVPDPSPFSHLPVRKIAATGVTAAATLVAMSAASAATSALRRRVEQR